MVIVTKDEYEFDFATRQKKFLCTVYYDSWYDEVYRPSIKKDLDELNKRFNRK